MALVGQLLLVEGQLGPLQDVAVGAAALAGARRDRRQQAAALEQLHIKSPQTI